MTVIDQIQTAVQPVIVEALLAGIFGAVAWVGRKYPAIAKLDIEARHRQALHQALDTGVGLLIDLAQKHPAALSADIAATQIVDYVQQSVPDALKNLGPTRAQLENMARAKLQQHLNRALGTDALSAALQAAISKRPSINPGGGDK